MFKSCRIVSSGSLDKNMEYEIVDDNFVDYDVISPYRAYMYEIIIDAIINTYEKHKQNVPLNLAAGVIWWFNRSTPNIDLRVVAKKIVRLLPYIDATETQIKRLMKLDIFR